VNTKIELYPMQMVERQAAHLRAERVEAIAHHARQVVERVLWDYDSTQRESQRLGLGYHQPICPEESWEQGSRQGVKADSVDDGGGGPQKGVQAARNNEASVRGPSEDEAWGLQEWAWYPPREAEMDFGGSSRPGTQKPGQANQLT
jgi:hypothetical protein